MNVSVPTMALEAAAIPGKNLAVTDWKAPSIRLRDLTAMLLVGWITAAVCGLSLWAGTYVSPNVLAALDWAAAWALWGLAIDNRGLTALLQALTGVLLAATAWAVIRIDADFNLLAGVVLSPWLAAWCLMRVAGARSPSEDGPDETHHGADENDLRLSFE